MRIQFAGLVLALHACSSAGPAAAPLDASSLDRAVTDAATDAASDARLDADVCELRDGFSAAPFALPHAPTGDCSADDIDGYYSACLDASRALPIQCQQFVAAHPACAECLLPRDPAARSGALITSGSVLRVNVGGCVALVLGDYRPDGCGAREQSALDCAAEACASCGSDEACPARVALGVCARFEPARCPELAGAAMCALDGTLQQRFRRVARVFCQS